MDALLEQSMPTFQVPGSDAEPGPLVDMRNLSDNRDLSFSSSAGYISKNFLKKGYLLLWHFMFGFVFYFFSIRFYPVVSLVTCATVASANCLLMGQSKCV